MNTKSMPPKEIQYDGWQDEIYESKHGYKYTLPQYWVLLTHKPVPKCLRMPGWDTDKFVYKRIVVNSVKIDNDDEFKCVYESGDDDSRVEANKIIELYGTVYDAYKYYKISDHKLTEKYRAKFEPYLVNKDGICEMCFDEHERLYNLCENKHTDGFCIGCYLQLKTTVCPLCRGKLHDVMKKNILRY